METILAKSVKGKISRGFRTIRWNSSNIAPETATKTFWQVESNLRKFNFIEWLKMEYFFGNPDLDLCRCLFDAPGVLKDDLYVELLLAKQQVSMELLVQRLNILQRLEGRRPWTYNHYYALSGNVNYFLLEIRQATRRATKFSGYVRNSSSVGSKSSNRVYIPEPEVVEWTNPVKIDYLKFLTVGEFTSGQPGDIFFTLTRTKSPKRKTILNK